MLSGHPKPLVVLWSMVVTTMATVLFSNDCRGEKPNIVFILADDLGYGELGCYGQEKIRTPNLDQLASQGMRFTQHYTGAPVCAPARCVLMTGQNLTHAQIRGNRDSGNGRPFPGQWPITADVVTLAEMLKQAGYATGGFGKWGLGPTDTTGSPIRQGFDRFYGYNCQRNAHSYYPPFLDSDETEVTINEYPIPGHRRQPEGPVLAENYRADNYAPDLILAEALKFIDQHADGPFFLYLPFVEPHVAMHPSQSSVDQYPADWDEEFAAYRGENGYLPNPRPRAAYAAMISDLDRHVAAILKRLEHHGLTDNTLVIFTSDNGPTHGGKDPRWNAGGAGSEFFNSTGGLKGFKGSCDEGGLRVPCIVKWPGQIKSGSTTDLPSYFPDWFPTLCSIAGGKLPNAETQALDGIDLVPELTGNSTPQREEAMMWEFPEYGGIVAIRKGNWKAIRRGLQSKKPGDWELYDLAVDRNETSDLASQHPEIVYVLAEAYLKTRSTQPNFPLLIYDEIKRDN